MEYKEKIAILELVVDLLQETDVKALETIEVNHTKYDDGSTGFSVNLTYPTTKDSKNKVELKIDGKPLGDVFAKKIR